MEKTAIISDVKKKAELFLIAFCIILYLIRTTIPVLKYPFLILYLVIGIYIFLAKRSTIFPNLKSSKNVLITVFLLFLYLLFACLFSDKIYLSVIKDIINMIIIITFMLILLVLVVDKKDLKTFIDFFLYLTLAFALIISIQRIYLFFYASSYSAEVFMKGRPQVDNNFVLVPIFFGMFSCLYFLSGNISRFKIFILNLLLFVCSVSILISGSRRGIVLFLLIYMLFISIQVWGALGKNQIIKKLFYNTVTYFFSFSIFVIVVVYILLYTSVYYKNNLLESIGTRSLAFTKIHISATVFRYLNMINRGNSYDHVYNRIWQPVFDPKDPEAGTGNGNYKIIDNLSGKNVEIVPAGSKGYLIDKTCIGDSSLTHAYFFQLINTTYVEKGDSLLASIYCFASEDFNGTSAAFRAVGAKMGNPDAFYNLNEKGSWQKLIMPISCDEGELKIYLYMNKGEVRNFSTLEGHLIFAYPEFVRIPVNKDVGRSSSVFGRTIENSFEKPKSQNGNLLALNNINSTAKIYKASLFTLPSNYVIAFIKSDPGSDPLRSWISRIVSEDTVYHGLKTNLRVSRTMDNFGDGRASRWKFAVNIFMKEFNLTKKLFGGGFNFLNWYGYYFMNDKTESDYPHNPFLHVLLYSGLLGLFVYVLFMYKVFYYYIESIREYFLVFIFFLITFYFTIFSGGCPFDPPVMGFFAILPFVMHSATNREKLKELN